MQNTIRLNYGVESLLLVTYFIANELLEFDFFRFFVLLLFRSFLFELFGHRQDKQVLAVYVVGTEIFLLTQLVRTEFFRIRIHRLGPDQLLYVIGTGSAFLGLDHTFMFVLFAEEVHHPVSKPMLVHPCL